MITKSDQEMVLEFCVELSRRMIVSMIQLFYDQFVPAKESENMSDDSKYMSWSNRSSRAKMNLPKTICLQRIINNQIGELYHEFTENKRDQSPRSLCAAP